MKKLYFLLTVVFFSLSASGQQIISVAPNTVNTGTQNTVLISTTGVFLSPSSTVNFGAGIVVKNTEVMQGQMLRATIDVDASATTGTRTITLTSDGKQLTYDDFNVVDMGSMVTASIEVVPVQKIYLTDLDPNNPDLAPLLFSVSVNNDNKQRTLKISLIIRGDETGEWGYATKTLTNAAPNAVVRFNNKEFDTYKVNTNNRTKLDEAAKQGRLPTDVYEYYIEVFDGNTKLTEASGRNILDNPIARPELIGPGNEISLQPEVINTATPFFQWFSQATSHIISVYPVFQGQTTREEIALNRPAWRQENVAGKNILYPVSAELLQEGTTYAWQVVGVVHGAKGDEKIYSDMFWFTYKKAELKNTPYSRILIEPEMPTVKTGEVTKFTVYGIDEKNVRHDIGDKVVWKVLPASLGSINSGGYFTAGKQPENVAVVAQYGNDQVFADVTIVQNTVALSAGWDMELFMKKLFGLP